MGEKKDKKELSQLLDRIKDNPIEEQLVQLLRERKLTITTAESLTGGLVAAALTSVPGASDCFKVGYITYSNKAKRKVLSVKKDLLRKEGAVSAPVAREMAIGAMMESEADLSVAVTGNAGPEGMEDKPVGLVYIAVCARGKTRVEEFHFEGDRREIREQTVEKALLMVKNTVVEKFV